jgi:hypothetical protein
MAASIQSGGGFLQTKAGKAVAIGGAVVALGVCLFSVMGSLGGTGVASNRGNFVDAETGRAFAHTLVRGETMPVVSPYSGKRTGYLAEMCGWTRDGKVRSEPVPVLLNQAAGKPGPTFCPDCGRLVVANNPAAAEGMTPPPTESEYRAGGKGRAGEQPSARDR